MPLLHPRATREHFRPSMLIALIVIHGLALAAPFTYTLPGLISFVIMAFVTGCLGVTLCYHRLLSHRSFKTHKIVKYFLMLCGTLALEGDPLWWSATHRIHHRESDQPMDPHSPKVSFLWGHVLWLMYGDGCAKDQATLERYVPDLANDPWAKFLAKYFEVINLAFLGLLMAIGYAIGGMKVAISMGIWGGFLRIAYVWHTTWFVNSVTHLFGYRTYETKDDSRNLWWVALVTFGEGWHNNHHANPSAARSGHRWWEIDVTYGIIKLMQFTGLAWKLHPVVATNISATVKPLKTSQQKSG